MQRFAVFAHAASHEAEIAVRQPADDGERREDRLDEGRFPRQRLADEPQRRELLAERPFVHVHGRDSPEVARRLQDEVDVHGTVERIAGGLVVTAPRL